MEESVSPIVREVVGSGSAAVGEANVSNKKSAAVSPTIDVNLQSSSKGTADDSIE